VTASPERTPSDDRAEPPRKGAGRRPAEAGDPARGTKAGRIWLALWIVFAVFLVVRTGVRDRGVITDHIEFGRRLVAAEPLYAPYLDPPRPLHPVYPPSFGILTAPYETLGERGARWAWGLTQVLALTAIGAVLIDALRRTRPELARPDRLGPILLLTFWLCGRYILRDTHGGGGNLINLALALGAWHRADAGRPIQAGLLLGTSLATKPTTVLFVPLLAVLGRWRAAAASLLTALGFFFATILIDYEAPNDWLRWLRGSIAYGAQTDLHAEPAYGFPPFTWMNQSLRPALSRYLGDVPEPFRDDDPTLRAFSGLGLGGEVVLWLYRALAAAFVVWSIAFAYVQAQRSRLGRAHAGDRIDPPPSPGPHLVAFAMFAILSLLLSPISWKAHHVALLPAMFTVAVAALHGPYRRIAIAFAVVYSLACLFGEEVVGKDLKNVQQSLYLTTFGTLALLCWTSLAAPRTLGAPRAATGPRS
jgi:hypothetical protein